MNLYVLKIAYRCELWTLNRVYHHSDKPAILYSKGMKVWYQYGKCHRDDGPAIININGSRIWCLNNQQYSEIEYDAELIKRGVSK